MVIVGALVPVATSATRDVGLVLWSLPPHMVFCASVHCAIVLLYFSTISGCIRAHMVQLVLGATGA